MDTISKFNCSGPNQASSSKRLFLQTRYPENMKNKLPIGIAILGIYELFYGAIRMGSGQASWLF